MELVLPNNYVALDQEEMTYLDGGGWVYMYTAEPYAFYRHSETKKWKMVQVTPTWTHVQNVVVNGWMSSLAGGYFLPNYRG